MKKIFIYYPSQHIGGAQIFFEKIAKILDKMGYQIGIFSNTKEYIEKVLVESGIKVNRCCTTDNETERFINEDDFILLTSFSYLYSIATKIDLSRCQKVIFFDLHPSNVIGQLPLGFLFRYKNFVLSRVMPYLLFYPTISQTRNIIQEGIKARCISFLCAKNYELNEFAFNLNARPLFIPIPIDVPLISKPIRDYGGVINILWVSRLDIDKVKILNLLIEDVEDFNRKSPESKVVLHIIGDGKAKSFIRTTKHTEVKYYGVLCKEELWRFAISSINCSYGVGTAALEIAALGIVTFLIPSMDEYSYYSNTSNRYLPLYMVDGCDVAVEKKHKNKTISFEHSIRMLIRNGAEDGVRCREHVKSFHNEAKIIEALLLMISSNKESENFVRSVSKLRLGWMQRTLLRLRNHVYKYV
ncbi:hypothetical protein IDAT_05925 [Pseudidiomarina atlantica]|uniref:Glycosyl transferase family 1 domain-containing protein n=1 Tax=Pseudidiomarina atlantica TaxID=1517416 RepID=A0A094L3H5_9GAMM|nr:hypothetical protein [Pseudidiomarina atlantica]KFZ29208.1 hypothetical protein IDAT_05925 [Pseudidiomarina atlantica]